jgi:hypothetical protein
VIEVLDTDKKLAAAMANDAAAFADTILFHMQRERILKAYEIAKREYLALDSEINKMQDTISYLRKLGIYDYDFQSRDLTKAYYKALEKGQPQLANNIKKELENVTKFGSKYVYIRDKANNLKGQLYALHYRFTEAKAEFEQKLPHSYIVESARISEKKTSPKRMVIVFASTITSVFFAFVVLLIIDSLKKYY